MAQLCFITNTPHNYRHNFIVCHTHFFKLYNNALFEEKICTLSSTYNVCVVTDSPGFSDFSLGGRSKPALWRNWNHKNLWEMPTLWNAIDGIFREWSPKSSCLSNQDYEPIKKNFYARLCALSLGCKYRCNITAVWLCGCRKYTDLVRHCKTDQLTTLENCVLRLLFFKEKNNLKKHF